MGFPVDSEFTFEGDQLFIVQASSYHGAEIQRSRSLPGVRPEDIVAEDSDFHREDLPQMVLSVGIVSLDISPGYTAQVLTEAGLDLDNVICAPTRELDPRPGWPVLLFDRP